MIGFGMGFGILGLLIMLLFLGGIIFFAVWFIKAIFSNNSNHIAQTNQRSDALEILAQRYARGEITREQYEIMKRVIS